MPFVDGGAERLVRGLVGELRRHGYRAESVSIPFKTYPKGELLAHRHVQQGTQAYALFATHQSVSNPAAIAFVSWLRSEAV